MRSDKNNMFSDMKNQFEPSDEAKEALRRKIAAEDAKRESKKVRRPYNITRITSAAAACLVIAITVVAAINMSSRTPAVTDDTSPSNFSEVTTTPEIFYEKKWEEKSLLEKFNFVNKQSNLTVSYRGGAKIDSGYAGEYICDVSMSGYDIYTDTTYDTTASLYILKDIPQSVAVALKYAGDDGYYSFVGDDFNPATLGELIDGMNLKKNIIFGGVYLSQNSGDTISLYQYSIYDSDTAWTLFFNTLFTKRDAVIVNDFLSSDENLNKMIFGDKLSISVSVPLLGMENLSATLTYDGWLWTNFGWIERACFIGEDAYNALYRSLDSIGSSALVSTEQLEEPQVPETGSEHTQVTSYPESSVIAPPESSPESDATGTSRPSSTTGYTPGTTAPASSDTTVPIVEVTTAPVSSDTMLPAVEVTTSP